MLAFIKPPPKNAARTTSWGKESIDVDITDESRLRDVPIDTLFRRQYTRPFVQGVRGVRIPQRQPVVVVEHSSSRARPTPPYQTVVVASGRNKTCIYIQSIGIDRPLYKIKQVATTGTGPPCMKLRGHS